MFKKLRVGFLLMVLFFVALGAWLDRARSTDWNTPLRVAVHPIAFDSGATVTSHLNKLTADDFDAIETFMQREAKRHGVAIEEPIRVELYSPIDSHPPALSPGANVLSRMLWSLKLRWWASRVTRGKHPIKPDIRIFVLYHDPAVQNTVPHSLGLQQGLIGVVHAFAAPHMTGANNIVVAHEMLHTLGATDKYDFSNGRPLLPDGIPEPQREPLYPQSQAEIMAGQRMLSDSQWEMPESLRAVAVGALTAREIGWTK